MQNMLRNHGHRKLSWSGGGGGGAELDTIPLKAMQNKMMCSYVH